MRKKTSKAILMLILLILVIMIASRHYSYHGYNINSIAEISAFWSSNLVIIINVLFLFFSFLPLVIELGLILFLIKNRREIIELMRNWKSDGMRSQKKQRNLLMQILAWTLVIALLAFTNISKRPLTTGIQLSNSTKFSGANLSISTNFFPSYIQESMRNVFSIINNFSLVAFGILLLIVVTFGIWSFHGKRELYSSSNDSDKQLENIIINTLHELENPFIQSDTKNIIIRCYDEMCRIIKEAGKEPKSYETVREFEKACLQTFQWLPAKPLHALTLLFEETLYSNHEITDDKIKIAISSLEEIRKSMAVKNANH
ncbi:MAG: DUF4129 domain-containing protein [Thermoprotei archaeon]